MKRYTIISATLIALSVGAAAVPTAAAASQTKVRHAARHTRVVRFYATVVRASAKGLVVRTRSGRVLRFSAAQIAHRLRPRPRRHHLGRLHGAFDTTISAGPVVIDIVGLQPGETLLITESIAPDGTITITITLPPSSVDASDSGVVTNVESDVFEITTSDGADVRLHMSAIALSNLNLQTCDTVDVTYHEDAGILVADSAQVTGTADSGDCAPTYDATGPITDVSGSSITVNSDQGPMTFNVSDPSITDGFQNGDVVDVTYTQNSDGSMDAVYVQFVEQDASGTVTAVSSNSLTITDSNTGQPDTFNADPNNGVQLYTYAFDGVHVGDQADVTYHETANGLVADCVSDQPAGS